MGADELDERDLPHEIERDDHPEIATRNFKSCALAVENFCLGRSRPHIQHRIPLGRLHESSPAAKGHFGLRMLFGKGSEDAPSNNAHASLCSHNGNIASK